MELVYSEKSKCCGCGLCAEKCPTNAISMQADSEGFSYPYINEGLCTDCAICQQICSFNLHHTGVPSKAFAFQLSSKAKRLESQSGGAFYALAKSILDVGGVVYGAAICEDFVVRHIRITKLSELSKLHGSKYVQSDLKSVFSSIKQDLFTKVVLFSGTPCQVSSILALEKEANSKNNLITCDIVCHGVPSPGIFASYIRFLESKYSGNMESFVFRDKSAGWHSHFEYVSISGKRRYTNWYATIFHSQLSLRPACFYCPYATSKRCSDITIADFWGVEKVFPRLDDNTGVSLVLVNSTKGEGLIESLSALGTLYDCDLKSCLQPQLIKPALYPANREWFWSDYQQLDSELFFTKYGGKLSYKYKFLLYTGKLAFFRRIKRFIKFRILKR